MQEALVTCSYFFQQAAYYNAKPKVSDHTSLFLLHQIIIVLIEIQVFGAQLVKAEMNQDKVNLVPFFFFQNILTQYSSLLLLLLLLFSIKKQAEAFYKVWEKYGNLLFFT